MVPPPARRLLRRGVEALPGVGPALIAALGKVRLARRVLQARRAARDSRVPDPETVYWIDPRRIRLHTNHDPDGSRRSPADRVFDPVADRGKVCDGDWDLSEFEFRDLEVYAAFEDVLLRNRPWEETAFYRRLAAGLGTGNNPWSVHTQQDLTARCAYLDRLIDSLRTHGYRLAHEVRLPGEEDGVEKHERFGSEIQVNIGRDGLYLFQDGRHRLAIAQILGLENVAVKVLVRHREWMVFRAFVASLASSRSAASDRAVLYQPACHPDLADIPAAHGCQDRLQAIRPYLPPDGGTALDLGANLGYFCHGLEDLGFRCTAIEHQPQIAAAAERLRDVERKTFAVVAADLFAAFQNGLSQQRFDVVLALNIFHHFLKQESSCHQLARWLQGLQVSQMFFEPHRVDEPQMQGAFRNLPETEFVDFLLEHSRLQQAQFIHRCEDGRSLYRLWR